MLRGRRSSSCRRTVPLLRQQVFHAGDAFAGKTLWDNFPGTCTFHPQNVSKARNINKHRSGTVLFLTQIVQQLVQGPETFSGTCSFCRGYSGSLGNDPQGEWVVRVDRPLILLRCLRGRLHTERNELCNSASSAAPVFGNLRSQMF